MNAIKIILIASFVVVLLWAFRNRYRVGLRAGARVAAVGLTVLAIVSIANPNILSSLAHHVGVGRGTDLLFYLFVVVFVFTSVGTYFTLREHDRRLVEVVRTAAIRDAVLSDGLPGERLTE
jgi:hypothetical protein